MPAYVIELCSAVVAPGTHFVEASDEQSFVSVFFFGVESGEVARLDVFAARFLHFLLERFCLACTRITKQHIGGRVAIVVQWTNDPLSTSLHAARTAAGDDEGFGCVIQANAPPDKRGIRPAECRSLQQPASGTCRSSAQRFQGHPHGQTSFRFLLRWRR